MCFGDCNGNGDVTIDELLILVNLALGVGNVDQCQAGDINSDGVITIDEIVLVALNVLAGCR
ncbi:MAG: hypothetical protein HY270_23515 [Deltaproteobacteria bacterium]|nr:hypothetical protein [Deltaproteobacteria bacterium]